MCKWLWFSIFKAFYFCSPVSQPSLLSPKWKEEQRSSTRYYSCVYSERPNVDINLAMKEQPHSHYRHPDLLLSYSSINNEDFSSLESQFPIRFPTTLRTVVLFSPNKSLKYNGSIAIITALPSILRSNLVLQNISIVFCLFVFETEFLCISLTLLDLAL